MAKLNRVTRAGGGILSESRRGEAPVSADHLHLNSKKFVSKQPKHGTDVLSSLSSTVSNVSSYGSANRSFGDPKFFRSTIDCLLGDY